MVRRLLVLFVALFCFYGVGLAEKVSGDVSTDIFVKVVGVDEFFRDGVNGIRFGATVAECGDKVRFSGSSRYRKGVYIYDRVDGLSLLGGFLSPSKGGKHRATFVFEGEYLENVVIVSYDEITYGVNVAEVVGWARKVWGEPASYEETSGEITYYWEGEERSAMIFITIDGSADSSIEKTVVALSVGY